MEKGLVVRLCRAVHMELGSLKTGAQNSVPLSTWAQYHPVLSTQQILNRAVLAPFCNPPLLRQHLPPKGVNDSQPLGLLLMDTSFALKCQGTAER